ncbi:MAG: hypothetical protein K2V38_04500 [Gemmataceae bacterium]|nr:hypothetical protein [Gemmataceae bacterium]
MLTSLVLTAAIAAPVPAPQPAAPTGAAPQIVELKPNADGKITIAVSRMEKMEVRPAIGIAVPPGGVAPQPAPIQPPAQVREFVRRMNVELSTVKDLVVTTADGKKIETEEALKKLEKGGIVVVTTDGKPVSPAFLKLFKDDVLVLSSPELVGTQFSTTPVRPLPGGGIKPLPAIDPAPAGLPALPPVQVKPAVQIEIAPAIVPAKPEK